MSNKAPSSNPSSRSSRNSSPASGQPRTGSGVTARRPSTPGPGGQPRAGTGGASRPTTPGPGGGSRVGSSGTAGRPITPGPGGGQPRRSATPGSRPTTPGQGAGSGNNAGLVSYFSSSSSAPSPSSSIGSPSPPRTTTITTTATATPTPIIADHLGGLRITLVSDTPPYTETAVPDGSPLFLSVAAAVNLGLKMLESPRGKDALVRLGVTAIQGWTSELKPHIFPVVPATDRDMTPWVTAYLNEMRTNMVPIRITNDLTGEGAALKFDWAEPTAAQPNKGLGDYVGSQAGILSLNKFIFDTIVDASKRIQAGDATRERTYEIQMAMMGITVAHELCHFFIGFLVGYRLPNTPPRLKYLERDVKTIVGVATGESGRWWEAAFFGGETRFLTEPLADLAAPDKHPLGYQQAGDMWLLDGNTTRISVIDRQCITGLLQFDFSRNTVPFQTVGGEQNLLPIKKTRLRMDQMRNLALGKDKDYVAPKWKVSKEELDAHNALRKRDFGGNDFRRLGMIPHNPKYLYKAVA